MIKSYYIFNEFFSNLILLFSWVFFSFTAQKILSATIMCLINFRVKKSTCFLCKYVPSFVLMEYYTFHASPPKIICFLHAYQMQRYNIAYSQYIIQLNKAITTTKTKSTDSNALIVNHSLYIYLLYAANEKNIHSI